MRQVLIPGLLPEAVLRMISTTKRGSGTRSDLGLCERKKTDFEVRELRLIAAFELHLEAEINEKLKEESEQVDQNMHDFRFDKDNGLCLNCRNWIGYESLLSSDVLLLGLVYALAMAQVSDHVEGQSEFVPIVVQARGCYSKQTQLFLLRCFKRIASRLQERSHRRRVSRRGIEIVTQGRCRQRAIARSTVSCWKLSQDRACLVGGHNNRRIKLSWPP